MQGYNFIYIDESGFNSEISKVYGYEKPGIPLVIKGRPRNKNISVITAVTAE